jgi:nucleotide-binding universal stress UspA family protein
MIPEIKKILFATDLSENAKYAFKYAAVIANKFEAKITILHVIETLSPVVESQLIGYLGEGQWHEMQKINEQEYIDKIKKRLNDFCNEMNADLKSCSFLVDEVLAKKGIPVEEILNTVNTANSDMVIMGTHGYGLLADAIIGSTARRVIRRCKKPVMAIRLPRQE